MEAVIRASVLAPLNISEALAASALASVSTVADAGVGVVSGMNRGEAVAARALHSEVLQKKEGGGGRPEDEPARDAKNVQ
jgi:hypothetical protein